MARYQKLPIEIEAELVSELLEKFKHNFKELYIAKAKEKGLTYWSAKDFLKNHRTMHSII